MRLPVNSRMKTICNEPIPELVRQLPLVLRHAQDAFNKGMIPVNLANALQRCGMLQRLPKAADAIPEKAPHAEAKVEDKFHEDEKDEKHEDEDDDDDDDDMFAISASPRKTTQESPRQSPQESPPQSPQGDAEMFGTHQPVF